MNPVRRAMNAELRPLVPARRARRKARPASCRDHHGFDRKSVQSRPRRPSPAFARSGSALLLRRMSSRAAIIANWSCVRSRAAQRDLDRARLHHAGFINLFITSGITSKTSSCVEREPRWPLPVKPSCCAVYWFTGFRGRPPFAPLERAAAALAADVARPARRAIHALVPKMPAIRPGSDRSTSNACQCRP